MIWRIVQKELLGHLLTLRFALGGICCVSLVTGSAFVLTRQYEGRVEAHRASAIDYESRLQRVTLYSELGESVKLEARRPPNPLSILCVGLDRELGDITTLTHGYVPVTAESSGSDNPYLAVFPSVDFTVAFQVVLSLLAFLFAYDAVCGEQEGGTLKLMLAGAVPRSAVLAGKYLGAMAALAIPLLLSLIAGLLTATSSEYLNLSGSDWARVGALFAAALLYLSLVYTVGILLSCASERSVSSLTLCIFSWVAAILVYPGAVTFVVTRLSPVLSDQSVRLSARELIRQADEKSKDLVKAQLAGGKGWVWEGVSTSGMGTWREDNEYGSGETVRVSVRSAADPSLGLQRNYYRVREALRIESADRIWLLWKDYMERHPLRQMGLARGLSRLSPAEVYTGVSAILAGTDLGAHQRFMGQARDYRREVIEHLRGRDAFGSREWFTDDRGRADVKGLPRYRWRPETAAEAMRRAGWDLAILVAWNAVLFWTAYILFVRRSAA